MIELYTLLLYTSSWLQSHQPYPCLSGVCDWIVVCTKVTHVDLVFGLALGAVPYSWSLWIALNCKRLRILKFRHNYGAL